MLIGPLKDNGLDEHQMARVQRHVFPVREWLIGGAAFAMLSACSGRQSEATQPAPERGTQIGEGGVKGEARLPKGVTVDDAGRWSLASAPPSGDRAASERPLAVPAGALFLFHQTPLSPAEAKAAQGKMVVVDTVMPPRYEGRIILDRGCLRLDTKERPAIRFSAPVTAALDEQGYLVVRPSDLSGPPMSGPSVRSPRVGEPVEWLNQYALETDDNVPRPVKDAAATAPIIARCGAGPVVEVPFSVQSSSVILAEERANAKRMWRSTYGLSEEEAEARVKACTGADCYPSPPPPVSNAADCPPGSAMESGVCRTAEGYIRNPVEAPAATRQ